MDDFEAQLSSLLRNPQLIEQIASMAQSLGQNMPPPGEIPEPLQKASPDFNPAMVGKLMHLAGQTGLKAEQSTLLNALKPYLSSIRLQKLEKAMRAAKLASLAPSLLGAGDISLFGR